MWEILKEYIYVFWISMLPISELRGALIYAAANPALNRFIALPVAIAGNIIPVPFLVAFGQKMLHWFADAPRTILPFFERSIASAQSALDGDVISTAERGIITAWRSLARVLEKFFAWFGRVCTKINDKAVEKSKSEKFRKYELLGLFIFVAIPSPGTGAWMGSLISAILHMDRKKAVPAIIAGVVLAGIIMTLGTSAVAGIVEAVKGA